MKKKIAVSAAVLFLVLACAGFYWQVNGGQFVQGASIAGVAPVENALLASGVDSAGLKRVQLVDPTGLQSVSLGSTSGKVVKATTNTLASSATTADQVVVTYTVTSGKTFYLLAFNCNARLTTYAATATYFGDCSLESPAGTKLETEIITGTGQSIPLPEVPLVEPIPIASGTVIRIVTTPSAVTAMTWRANLIGYEK